MSNRLAIVEVLRAFAGVMAERQDRWYLFGAQAANIWGTERLSTDVDVTVQIDVAEADEFIRLMQQHGFALTRDDAQPSRLIKFVHRNTQVPLDVVIGGPGLDEQFLDRAITVDVGGASVPVVTPEDLIVMKALAGRAKDVEDLRAVVDRHRATLDVARIRSLLSLLEQALTRSDMLPLFEKAWDDAL